MFLLLCSTLLFLLLFKYLYERYGVRNTNAIIWELRKTSLFSMEFGTVLLSPDAALWNPSEVKTCPNLETPGTDSAPQAYDSSRNNY